MLVYVLDVNGQPLMPTHRCGKVHRLLKNNQAKVIKRCPFTIQLLYETTANTQPITLGIDAGSKVVGVSASTETEELYSAEGTKKLNQASYKVFGFRLFDKVRYQNTECSIFGRRSSGCFDVRTLDGKKLSAGVSHKKLKYLEPAGNYLTERRKVVSSHD